MYVIVTKIVISVAWGICQVDKGFQCHAQLDDNSIICTQKKTVVPANCYAYSIVICRVQISINCKTNNVCYGQNILGINIRNNTMQ